MTPPLRRINEAEGKVHSKYATRLQKLTNYYYDAVDLNYGFVHWGRVLGLRVNVAF